MCIFILFDLVCVWLGEKKNLLLLHELSTSLWYWHIKRVLRYFLFMYLAPKFELGCLISRAAQITNFDLIVQLIEGSSFPCSCSIPIHATCDKGSEIEFTLRQQKTIILLSICRSLYLSHNKSQDSLLIISQNVENNKNNNLISSSILVRSSVYTHAFSLHLLTCNNLIAVNKILTWTQFNYMTLFLEWRWLNGLGEFFFESLVFFFNSHFFFIASIKRASIL